MKVKKILTIIISAIIFVVYTIPEFPVNSLEMVFEDKSISLIYNNAISSTNVKVDSEQNIYMDTDDISKYTPFTYSSENKTFYYDNKMKMVFAQKILE